MKTVGLALLFATACLGAPAKKAWPGWRNIKHMFVFGDSYTQTGFDPTGTQPNPSNPFGNPPYPGWTSSNGPNWLDFLTTTYNRSQILTYNLAYGGATVSSTLIPPYAPTVKSLSDQITQQFLPLYASNASSIRRKWRSGDTLFATFIGINDVGNSWYKDNASAIQDAVFAVQNQLFDSLYSAGARNFLLLNVPPVNLAPLTLEAGEWSIEHEGLQIAAWNARVKDMAKRLRKRYKDVTVFEHDTWKLYTDVVADPGRWPQTSALKNVTGYCKAYENGTPTPNATDPSCAYPVDEYLWLNNLHPTYPVHNATAASIAQLF